MYMAAHYSLTHVLRKLINCSLILFLLLTLFRRAGAWASATPPNTFTVNMDYRRARRYLQATGFVCLPTGRCTLRAAIMETNALAGADTILFDRVSGSTFVQLPTSSFGCQRGDDYLWRH